MHEFCLWVDFAWKVQKGQFRVEVGEVTYYALISVLMLSYVDAEWNGMVGLLDLNDRLNNCAHFVRFRSRV